MPAENSFPERMLHNAGNIQVLLERMPNWLFEYKRGKENDNK
jgi:hypothetical protein